MKKVLLLLSALAALNSDAQHTDSLKYGNFNNWITRQLKE
jgi:hypothetical protein